MEECSPATFDTCMISETLNLDEFLRQKCFQGRQVETSAQKLNPLFRVVLSTWKQETNSSHFTVAVDPKGGNSLVKLNSRDYCSNINVKIPISAAKLVWEKPRRKNCNRHVAFLIHTVLSSCTKKAVCYITSLLRSFPQFRENFIRSP